MRARRTFPRLLTSILSMKGEAEGNTRSTPIPEAILRTVKVAVCPLPRRWITTPWNFCKRSLLPSRILIVTVTVSPAPNSGHSGVSTILLAMSLIRSIVLTFTAPVNWGAILRRIAVGFELPVRNLFQTNQVATLECVQSLVLRATY